MTGYSDIKTAVDVMKMGAFDYISKPLIPDEVLNVLNKASQDSGEALPVPQTEQSQRAKEYSRIDTLKHLSITCRENRLLQKNFTAR